MAAQLRLGKTSPIRELACPLLTLFGVPKRFQGRSVLLALPQPRPLTEARQHPASQARLHLGVLKRLPCCLPPLGSDRKAMAPPVRYPGQTRCQLIPAPAQLGSWKPLQSKLMALVGRDLLLARLALYRGGSRLDRVNLRLWPGQLLEVELRVVGHLALGDKDLQVLLEPAPGDVHPGRRGRVAHPQVRLGLRVALRPVAGHCVAPRQRRRL